MIKTLKGRRIRPTSEKVRESLFNILAQRVEGSRVLDLFAGSGALGLEALSRGAREAVFVEKWPPAARIIKENAEALSLSPLITVIPGGVSAAVTMLRREGKRFEIILADPPYRSGKESAAGKLLLELSACDTLAPAGILAVEHFSKTDLPQRAGRWCRQRRARYGQTCISFFEYAKNSNLRR